MCLSADQAVSSSTVDSSEVPSPVRECYGPGAPQHGKDFLVPALRTILGDANLLALDVRPITPELTYAPTVEPLRHLLPQHRASLEEAHTQARRHAVEIAGVTAAAGPESPRT